MSESLSEWRPAVDREIERVLPRELTADYLRTFFGEGRYEYDPDAIEDALSTPVWDLLDRGGKRWRAVVFLMLVEGFGADPETFLPYAVIPEILHNGTIIVDDVEDGAEIRRGEEAVHHRYGQDIALNAGNALYFIPLKILERDPADLDPETRLAVYEMLTYELNRTHLGQGMDIRWHNSDEIAITEAEYMEMCACKTGCLGRIVGRLAAIVTDQSDDVESELAAFMETVCIAFQIADDILDVEHSLDEAGDFGKAIGNDIKEGKKTLIAVHAVRNAAPEDAACLQEILAADDTTDAEALAAIEIMEEAGSVEYARERAIALVEEAHDHLDDVPLTDEIAAELAAFAEYVVERDV
ncbi:octaprenyl diphosphate synthase / Dimethylallyltransferase / (2E,6E)-farnesyl diphosphate synthase / Geranylgeranyl diphosphate synthase [Halarchaeum acidiphilum MH1-52-1]|uniref:Octaprenyl diphosphate synthase / Dimethylallyltransferase / (2E,6E)-farnesyl diphosphate synthase / Geranylgeranyl diphosphate synthase n=2 Tax=Halarchaeum acidiphilum TaxID=489138 RepID=U2YWQ4_9EURY|nr:polyprenyl synthetase family protein [Halarchaeum acidiphilum]GAD53222.1 octaprenyl diphosphate synthase / Dimethylallyltransferase / (2E,6E)-farnesyl diphosphate synthase / Geranylgeranyl diphosphate synthase [Halarchaeum acidiphilum MH1-52-1]